MRSKKNMISFVCANCVTISPRGEMADVINYKATSPQGEMADVYQVINCVEFGLVCLLNHAVTHVLQSYVNLYLLLSTNLLFYFSFFFVYDCILAVF